MSNNAAVNPMILDTATATAITNDQFVVTHIRWVGGSAADSCDVQDENGNTQWESVGDAANFVDRDDFAQPVFFNGLKVPTLDAGNLYIYWRPR